jgi:hypothetical protein
MKRYLFSLLIDNRFDLKLKRILLNVEVQKTKIKFTSPESAMITSIEGLSPDPFGTFSVEIQDMRGTVRGNVLFTNQLSEQSPCLQGLSRIQPTTES